MIRLIIRIALGDSARVQHGLLGPHARLRLLASVGARQNSDLARLYQHFLQIAQAERLLRQYCAYSAHWTFYHALENV